MNSLTERKIMATSSNKKASEKFERNITGMVEPTQINPLNYNIDLMNALNVYNIMFDNKDKYKWVLNYLKKENKNLIPKIDQLPDYEYRTLGTVIRMKERGLYLEDKELNLIPTLLDKLQAKQVILLEERKRKEAQEKKDTALKVIQQDRTKEMLHDVLSEFDNAIDEFLVRNGNLVDVVSILESKNTPKNVVNAIQNYQAKLIPELDLAIEGKDEQIKEAYAFTTKAKLKKLKEWILDIPTKLKNYSIAKKTTVVRVSKPKSPLVMVKRLKYKIEDAFLGIKSAPPTSIIGASSVWLLDTKTRRLINYVGENLSVKGSAIMNFDPEKSGSKILRKIETIKEFTGLTKKMMTAQFQTIKAVSKTPNGRVNQDMLIIKVY